MTALPAAAALEHSALPRFEARLKALVRSRLRQVVIEHALTGLSMGLLGSSVVVLVVSLIQPLWPGWSTLQLVAALVGLSLMGGLLVAWWRRPDEWSVAIDTDQRLRLQERFATTLEYARHGPDPIMCERLARRAVAIRLPGALARVFPVRYNLWARLVPVAAALVIVISLIELPPVVRPEIGPAPDQEVVAAGIDLEDYATAMAVRARQDGLRRAAQQAGALADLATDMRSGRLDRSQALDRLRGAGGELSRQAEQALTEAPQTDVGAVSLRALPGSGQGNMESLRDVLSRIAQGRLLADEAMGSGETSWSLEGSGVSRDQLDRALRQHADGDSEALLDLLRALPDGSTESLDARELIDARDAVDRARERLGDSSAVPGPGAAAGQVRPGDADSEAAAGEWGADEPSGTGSGASGDGLSGGAGQGRGQTESDSSTDGAVLKPDARLGAGGVLSGEARVLPRINTSAVAPAAVHAQYITRAEEVMSKEFIPPHQKDFVRRYFLNLGASPQGRGVDDADRGAEP